MKIIIIEPDFSKVEAEVLIIGVPEHPENIEGWDGFVILLVHVYQNG